jgi:DNA-binding PadR family transcriptional regulator
MPLSTTSYAILGLLATRPWSAYELANHWQVSNLRLLWPRAQSNLYREPKRLVAEGLATASTKRSPHRQGQSHTVYRITAKGRRALAAWLAEPTTRAIGFESEALLKIVNANHGSLDDLLAQIDGVASGLLDEKRRVAAEFETMLDAGLALPERAHLGQLHWSFLRHFGRALEAWAKEAREIVISWEDTEPDEAKLAAAQERLQGQLDELKGDLK